MNEFDVIFNDDSFEVQFEESPRFSVSLSDDSFEVDFGAQGPQGPAGEDAVATPYDSEKSFRDGELARDTANDDALYLSLSDNNLGNPLTDTTHWRLISTGALNMLDQLQDVTITDPTDDQVLTYSSGQWVNLDSQGGSTPHPQASVSLSYDNTITAGFNTDQVETITLNVGPSGSFTFSNIVTAKASEGTVTINNNVVTLTIPAANNTAHDVHVDVNFNYTQDSDDSNHSDTLRATIHIEDPFYQDVTSTQPTDVGTMTSLGVWTGSDGPRMFTTSGDNNNLYYALPTRSGGYTFTSGQVFIDVTSLGVISTDFTLYRIDDYVDDVSGRDIYITVENA